MAAVLAALGQERRIQILALLRRHDDGLSVNSIATALGIRQNSASIHLGILARHDLVIGHRSGREVFYRCSHATIQRAATFITSELSNSTS